MDLGVIIGIAGGFALIVMSILSANGARPRAGETALWQPRHTPMRRARGVPGA